MPVRAGRGRRERSARHRGRRGKDPREGGVRVGVIARGDQQSGAALLPHRRGHRRLGCSASSVLPVLVRTWLASSSCTVCCSPPCAGIACCWETSPVACGTMLTRWRAAPSRCAPRTSWPSRANPRGGEGVVGIGPRTGATRRRLATNAARRSVAVLGSWPPASWHHWPNSACHSWTHCPIALTDGWPLPRPPPATSGSPPSAAVGCAHTVDRAPRPESPSPCSPRAGPWARLRG
jgi:hypothetical protein